MQPHVHRVARHEIPRFEDARCEWVGNTHTHMFVALLYYIASGLNVVNYCIRDYRRHLSFASGKHRSISEKIVNG